MPAVGGRAVRRGTGGGAVAAGPGGRGNAQRVVGGRYRSVGGTSSPSGDRRGVVANPVGGPEHRLVPTPQRTTRSPAGRWHLVRPVGVAAGRLCASPGCRRAGRRLAAGGR